MLQLIKTKKLVSNYLNNLFDQIPCMHALCIIAPYMYTPVCMHVCMHTPCIHVRSTGYNKKRCKLFFLNSSSRGIDLCRVPNKIDCIFCYIQCCIHVYTGHAYTRAYIRVCTYMCTVQLPVHAYTMHAYTVFGQICY